MDYTIKPLKELLTICKNCNLNYNNKTKKEIIILLINYDKKENNEEEHNEVIEEHNEVIEEHNEVIEEHNEVTEEHNEVTEEHNEVTAETVREQKLDKFYTIPSIAELCINKVNEKYKLTNFDLIIEPSAGNGSFLLQLPIENCIGFGSITSFSFGSITSFSFGSITSFSFGSITSFSVGSITSFSVGSITSFSVGSVGSVVFIFNLSINNFSNSSIIYLK